MFTTFWCYIEIFFWRVPSSLLGFFRLIIIFIIIVTADDDDNLMRLWKSLTKKNGYNSYFLILFSYITKFLKVRWGEGEVKVISSNVIIVNTMMSYFPLLPRKKKRKQNCHLILCLFVSANTYNQQHQTSTSTSKISKHTFLKMFLLRWNKQKKEREET